MNYEEKELECEICGKKVKRTVRSGKNKNFLCQQCAKQIIQTR